MVHSNNKDLQYSDYTIVGLLESKAYFRIVD